MQTFNPTAAVPPMHRMPDDQRDAFARSLFARVIQVEEGDGSGATGQEGEAGNPEGMPVVVRNSMDSEIRKKMA